MRITVLVENTTPSSRLTARHGLSLWVEARGKRVLFDMGPGDAFLANARALGIDVVSADAAVLSHGHYDHGGGLGPYLAATEGACAPVYVHEGAFDEHRSGTPRTNHDAGLDPALAGHPRIVSGAGTRVIFPGLSLIDAPGHAHPRPSSNTRMLMRSVDVLVPDTFAHEQSLLIEEDGRRVLIAGCAHAGILNIMDRAEEIAGAPLDAVIAGFHQMSPSAGTGEDETRVRALARALAVRPARYVTFHCTGLAAFALLRDELGPRITYGGTGSVFEL